MNLQSPASIFKQTQGSRSLMLTAERFLVESRPGPLNHEAWAGLKNIVEELL